MRGLFQEALQGAFWLERTGKKPVGVVKDVAVAQGGGAGIHAADGLRDGRNDEKPSVGKRLAEKRGYVPRIPHPPRQDENEGRRSLQENVEDFLFKRALKAAHHARHIRNAIL